MKVHVTRAGKSIVSYRTQWQGHVKANFFKIYEPCWKLKNSRVLLNNSKERNQNNLIMIDLVIVYFICSALQIKFLWAF